MPMRQAPDVEEDSEAAIAPPMSSWSWASRAPGKTTIGPLLAARLGVPYAEGDDFHPPANIDKMTAGTPLTTTTAGPGWTPSASGRTDGPGSAGW